MIMSPFTGLVLIDLIGIVVAIFAVIYAYFSWAFQSWKRKNIPNLEPHFPFGNSQPLGKAVHLGEDIYNIVNRAKKQGWRYFGMYLSVKPFFVPLDLEIVRCILSKDFNHFADRGMYYNERDDPLSANLFTIESAKWRHLRAKLTPTFTSGKMKGMFQILVDCGILLKKSLKQLDLKEPIDIKHILACYSTDIIGSCAFGLECDSFKEDDSPFLRYGQKIFERTKLMQITDFFTMTFPVLSRSLHLKSIPTDVSTFFYDIVTKTVNYREKNNVYRTDFLQLLIDIKNNKGEQSDAIKGAGETLTMDEMVAQCFLFFVAGFETSSTTMTFVLYELSLHPEIQEKVRGELLTVLKKYSDKICYDSLKELTYMQQVIDEALRKYPPVPFLNRICIEDYRIPDTDVILDKGTDVLIPVKNIHYDEDIYENPMKFDPERFSPEKKHERSQFAHIPFGEGPRNCIGLRFGIMQSKVGLAAILSNFRVKLSPKTKTPLEMDPKSFVFSVKGGMWLNLEQLQ